MQKKDNVTMLNCPDTFYFNFVDSDKLDLIIDILNSAKAKRVINISDLNDKYFSTRGNIIDLCFIVNDFIKEDSF